MSINRKKIKNVVLDIIVFTIGSLLFDISINLFTEPNQLAPGGFIGIATMIAYIFNISGSYIFLINFIVNIPVFIWAWKEAGFGFIAKSVVAMGICTLISPLISFIPKYTSVANGGTVPSSEFEMMIVALLAGVIGGLGIALIFMRGGTTGGVDIVASLIGRHIRHISIGKLLLALDVAIIVASAFVYGNLESPIYAAIVVFVTTKVIDTVLYGIDIGRGKMIFIISPENKKIAKKIMADLRRGVTELKSRGAYTGREGEVLLCAVRRHEVYKTYELIHSIDENAFIVVGDAGEITGEGFKDPKENIK